LFNFSRSVTEAERLTQRGKAATKVAGSGKWLVASGKRKNLRASRRSSDL